MNFAAEKQATSRFTPPALLLRLEGLALLLAAVALYAQQESGWLLFALLLLAPDLGMLGYLITTRIGAITYNALHTTVGPLLLAAAGLWLLPDSQLLPLALIWLAHIGMDRTVGYGLKYADDFKRNHLGAV